MRKMRSVSLTLASGRRLGGDEAEALHQLALEALPAARHHARCQDVAARQLVAVDHEQASREQLVDRCAHAFSNAMHGRKQR